jgi:thiol-disulfide isomerase/thioredoxin
MGCFSEPCQKLYPELDAAAEVLSPKAISIVSVNCTAEVKLCSSYNVTSYPTLRVFRGPENVTRFRDQRKAKSCDLLILFKLNGL